MNLNNTLKWSILMIPFGLINIALAADIGSSVQTSNSATVGTQPKETDSAIPGLKHVTLLREDFRIVDRKAKLVKHPKDNRWFLFFEPFEQPKAQAATTANITATALMGQTGQDVTNKKEEDQAYTWPLEVLPGKWLASMARVLANEKDVSITFRIWGTVTLYNNRNYVLPNMVATQSLFGTAMKDEKAATAMPTQYSSQTPVNNQTEKIRFEKLATQLKQKLLMMPRTYVLETEGELTNVDSTSQTNAKPALGGGFGGNGNWKDGTVIKDRIGRLSFDDQKMQYLFTFDSDSAELSEPPVIVHPNSILAEMETMLQGQLARQVRFRVTGQISRFQNQDFILLQKVLRTFNGANLGQ